VLNFPIDQFDTNKIWEEAGILRQVITNGNEYWYRSDVKYNNWEKGLLFDNEVNQTSHPFPSSIDTNSVLPQNGKILQVITKDNLWWYRADTNGPWTQSGQLFSKESNLSTCAFPLKLDSNTLYKDPNLDTVSQVSISDNTYWYRADNKGPWQKCGKFMPSILEDIKTHSVKYPFY